MGSLLSVNKSGHVSATLDLCLAHRIRQAGDAVRVGAAAVGVDERDGDGLGLRGAQAGGLEQRLRPALELSGSDQ